MAIATVRNNRRTNDSLLIVLIPILYFNQLGPWLDLGLGTWQR